jgi:hypothetical protein
MNLPTRPTPSALGRHPEPAELAAFIDGRLSRTERTHIADHVTACADCYEVFAEAVHILDEEESPEEAEVPPSAEIILHPRAHWGRWVAAPAALAAAAALALVLGFPGLREGLGWSAPSAATLAARLDVHGDRGLRLEKDWETNRGWRVFRGAGEAVELAPQTQATFRVGALAMDLLTVLRLQDRDNAAETALDLQSSLAKILFTEGQQEAFGQLAERLKDQKQDLAPLTREAAKEEAELARELDSPDGAYALGRWAEAGRLAAAGGDLNALRRWGFRHFPGRFELAKLPPPIAAELEPLRKKLKAGVEASDVPAIEKGFAALVKVGGETEAAGYGG